MDLLLSVYDRSRSFSDLMGKKNVFLRDKDFILSCCWFFSPLLNIRKVHCLICYMTFKEICTEKNFFFLTFVNFTGRILLVERLRECLPAISVCSVCATKKSPARRSPISVRVNELCGNNSPLLIYPRQPPSRHPHTTISDPFWIR